jgi:hypothetical protein
VAKATTPPAAGSTKVTRRPMTWKRFATGIPRRIVRRVKYKLVGRLPGRSLFRWLWE